LKYASDDLLVVSHVEASVAEVAECNFVPGLDGLLGEEDLDPVVVFVPVGSVGDTGVVHPRQTQTDDLKPSPFTTPKLKRSIRGQFLALVQPQDRFFTLFYIKQSNNSKTKKEYQRPVFSTRPVLHIVLHQANILHLGILGRAMQVPDQSFV
jgi:hypothetical protein